MNKGECIEMNKYTSRLQFIYMLTLPFCGRGGNLNEHIDGRVSFVAKLFLICHFNVINLLLWVFISVLMHHLFFFRLITVAVHICRCL